MKPGLCFSTLGCVPYTLEQVIDLSRRFGIASVEIRGLGGILDNREIPAFSPDEIDNTARRFAEAGVSVACLGTSCAFHKAEGLDGVIEEGTASAKIASRLSCPYIRVFGNKIARDVPRGPAIERVGKGTAALAERIEGTGVSVLLETHGDFTDAETLGTALGVAARRDVGLVWDVAHTEKAVPGSYAAFLDRFFPFIKHVHVKDFRDGGELCLPGDGILPLREIIQLLAARGYSGKISLEWEKKWHPELPPIETALDSFLTLVNSISAAPGACSE